VKILFVCLGNICRSPTAEVVLRTIAAREAPELDLEVDSAGTAAYHVGEPPDPRTREAGARRGLIEVDHAVDPKRGARTRQQGSTDDQPMKPHSQVHTSSSCRRVSAERGSRITPPVCWEHWPGLY